MPYSYEVWRLVEEKDDGTDTWEFLERFPTGKRARQHIQEMAGTAVLSSEDNDTRFSFDDPDGLQVFRIEGVFKND